MVTVKEIIQPDETQIKEIRKLERICKKHDGLQTSLFLDASLNFNKEMKSFLLLYDGDNLVSVMAIFAPTRNEAELSALTLPQSRRKGYFNRLYFRAVDEIKRVGIKDVLFTCERCSDSGFEAISSRNAKLDHTEYSLKFNKDDSTILSQADFTLVLCEAAADELDTLAALSAKVFDESEEDAKGFVTHALESENRTQFVAKLDGKPIGMVSTGDEQGDVTIYGVGILPEYRGKGYGRQMLTLALKTILAKGCQNILIEVDSTNNVAYKLYTSSGFEEESTVDYYRKKL